MSYYVPFDLSDYPLRTPIPVSVWDSRGRLLLARGAVLVSELQRAQLQRHQPVMRGSEAELWHGTYLAQLDRMLRDDRPIAQIMASGRPTFLPPVDRPAESDAYLAVQDITLKTRQMFEFTDRAEFETRARSVAARLQSLVDTQWHATVLYLLWTLHDDGRKSSPTYALLSAAAVLVGARHLPAEAGGQPVDLGVQVLVQSWLRAQYEARTTMAGPSLAPQIDACAQPSHALTHSLVSASLAWTERLRTAVLEKPCNFGDFTESLYPQEVGVETAGLQALEDAFGHFVPGVCVELANKEVAVIARHPRQGEVPRVMSFVNAQGAPIETPIVRQVGDPRFQIRSTVPPHQVKVRVDPRKFQAR